MKKNFWLIALLGTLLGLMPVAAAMADDMPLDHAPDRTDNLVALQRGARTFVNFCLNCHSANVVRYNALQALGIPPDEIQKNLILDGAKVGDTMTVAMQAADAKNWFGTAPPDLSLEERARGADWLYTYLRSFYRDDTRPTGWNNLVYQNVAMPHVLWQLQGQRTARFEQRTNEDGEKINHFVGYQQVTPGTMSTSDYDETVADLVSYMTWMAEPTRHTREQVGVWVLLFLAVLSFLAWRLNAAYWKDID